jgi:vancomycin permeability regulator SanA
LIHVLAFLKRRWLRLALLACAVAVSTVAASAIWVRVEAIGHLFGEKAVPAAPVALVLGTEVDTDGKPSTFLAARLEIARQLFADGKVKVILVSGDHLHWAYDEPDTMMGWLVDHGVPQTKIVLDYAGFDTYDSCVRAKRIFGVTRAIVVTQSFHLPRAVTLCRQVGVDADGVGDDSVKKSDRFQWFVSSAREYPAAVKAVADLVSGRDPTLGKQEIGVQKALAS